MCPSPLAVPGAMGGPAASTSTATAAVAVGDRLVRLVMLHEGWRPKPYWDSVGKLTIGYGRNLTDVGLSAEEGRILLRHDLEAARATLDRLAPWWEVLDEVRAAVLLDMAFNLGAGLAQFRTLLGAVERGDYPSAAAAMLNSLWARQVGTRAVRLVEMMRSGEWPEEVMRGARG